MTKTAIILGETIENCTLFLRGQKVILSFHLAEMYGVETREPSGKDCRHSGVDFAGIQSQRL